MSSFYKNYLTSTKTLRKETAKIIKQKTIIQNIEHTDVPKAISGPQWKNLLNPDIFADIINLIIKLNGVNT